MLTLSLLTFAGSLVAAFIAGALVNGKLILPKLHAMPESKTRDVLLRAANGGPGSLPR
jgi:hypothetical protein